MRSRRQWCLNGIEFIKIVFTIRDCTEVQKAHVYAGNIGLAQDDKKRSKKEETRNNSLNLVYKLFGIFFLHMLLVL